MTKYIFENKEEKQLKDCDAEDIKAVVNAVYEGGRCYYRHKSQRWEEKVNNSVGAGGIYRVIDPGPTPNEVDWSQIPKQLKYCFVEAFSDTGIFTTTIPIEGICKGDWCLTLAPMASCRRHKSGEQGFKRGTVKSIDSLLVRPIGE